jgi:hypothetical protein
MEKVGEIRNLARSASGPPDNESVTTRFAVVISEDTLSWIDASFTGVWPGCC